MMLHYLVPQRMHFGFITFFDKSNDDNGLIISISETVVMYQVVSTVSLDYVDKQTVSEVRCFEQQSGTVESTYMHICIWRGGIRFWISSSSWSAS